MKRDPFSKICIFTPKYCILSIFLLTSKWKWLLWSNLSYVVIYLVNWRKVASKKPFLFGSQQKNAQKAIFWSENTYFWKRCSLRLDFFYKLIPNLLGHPVMQIRGKYFLGNWKNTSLSFLLPRSINGMCGRLELWNLTTFAENAICRGDFKWWCQLRIWLRKK